MMPLTASISARVYPPSGTGPVATSPTTASTRPFETSASPAGCVTFTCVPPSPRPELAIAGPSGARAGAPRRRQRPPWGRPLSRQRLQGGGRGGLDDVDAGGAEQPPPAACAADEDQLVQGVYAV